MGCVVKKKTQKKIQRSLPQKGDLCDFHIAIGSHNSRKTSTFHHVFFYFFLETIQETKLTI